MPYEAITLLLIFIGLMVFLTIWFNKINADEEKKSDLEWLKKKRRAAKAKS